MSIDLSCVSFNVAGLGDMIELLRANPTKIQDARIQAIAIDCLNQADYEALTAYAKEHYIRLAVQTFTVLLQKFSPHIICLQEITRHEEHAPIIQLLQTAGYDVIQQYGLAIAFNRLIFRCINSQMTITNETGALFADLQVGKTKKIIRVVSDHPAGFNVKSLLQTTNAAPIGDAALAQNISLVDHLAKKQLWHFPCFGKNETPDTILYGLDANTTAAFIPPESRIHPERLQPFPEHGFATDTANHTPTICDHNAKTPYKYDYIFCKTTNGNVSITDHVVEEINSPEILGDPSVAMSDHLPVLSTISFSYS